MTEERHQKRLQNARQLRRDMTPWERKLWYLFLQSYPMHVYKQRPIGPYIVDFYCPEAKLAIELDGSQHFEDAERAYDARRSSYLEERGIQVLRVANIDVDKRFDSVRELIDREIRARQAKKE